MTTEELALHNQNLRYGSPEDIVQFALQKAQNPVLTTNFRPYEAAILHLVTRFMPDIPIIWCDTGYNTPATYRHAKLIAEQLKLNIRLYVPAQSAAYRAVFLGIPELGTPEHELFTAQVKLEPFRRAMKEHEPDLWFTNLRKGQTQFRDSLDIMTMDSAGLIKISPFFYWSDSDLDQYLIKHGLENEFNYYDPTKVLANRECGLHTN